MLREYKALLGFFSDFDITSFAHDGEAESSRP